MKKLSHHKIYLLCILFFSIFIMTFLSIGEVKNAHDISFHVSNIDTLSSYIDPFHFRFTAPLITKTTENLGYGLYLFYPSFPHLVYAYLCKFLHLLHISTLSSIYIGNTFFTIFTSYLLYFLSYRLSKNKKVAFLSSILYIVFPYRLSNIFVRFAINETFSLFFLLLILYSLLDLKEGKRKRFFYLFTISTICLIYTHLAITFYFFLLIIPYFFLYRKELLKKEIFSLLLKSFLCIFIMTLPFLLSLGMHLPLHYVAFKKGYMTSLSLINANRVSLKDLIYLNQDYWSVITYVSLPILCFFVISFCFAIYNKKKFYLFLYIVSFLCFFFMSPFFPWDKMPSFFYFIQFPWRIETILCVLIPLLSPYFLTKMKYFVYPFLFIVLFSIFPSIERIQNTPYHLENGVILRTYETGNLGEYYPEEYLKDKDYYKKRGNDILLKEGEIAFQNVKEDFPNLPFEVTYVKNAEVEFPRLYYLGYELKKGKEKVKINRSENGMLSANIKEKGTYKLFYKKPSPVRVSILLKYSFFGLFIFLNWKNRKYEKGLK